MPVMTPRYLEKHVGDALKDGPAVAILGPRQCGKTTLARYMVDRVHDDFLMASRIAYHQSLNISGNKNSGKAASHKFSEKIY